VLIEFSGHTIPIEHHANDNAKILEHDALPGSAVTIQGKVRAKLSKSLTAELLLNSRQPKSAPSRRMLTGPLQHRHGSGAGAVLPSHDAFRAATQPRRFHPRRCRNETH
jgi:hypothetical protein